MSAPSILTDKRFSTRPVKRREDEHRVLEGFLDLDQELSEEEVYRVLMEEISRLHPGAKNSAA